MGDPTQLIKGDEKKLFKLNFDTYLYTKQIRDYQKYTNILDLNLVNSLHDLVNTVYDLLKGAQLKDTHKTSLDQSIKSNFDLSNALVKKSFVCVVCHLEMAGRENMIKHFNDQKHKKNVGIRDKLLQAEKVNNPLTDQNKALVQLQKNARKADKLEKRRLLLLNPFGENLPKATSLLLSKPIQQIEQLTLRLIDEGRSRAHNIRTYQAVCKLIEVALNASYPKSKCYVFGSRITGLSTEKGDIDIFVDIGDRFYDKPSKREIVDAIHKTEILLRKTKMFNNFQKVLAARTPILRTYCNAEKIDCDLSFTNGLSFCNTELINYFLNLQPICRKLVTFLKHWFGPTMNNICVSNYLVTLLAIFYLQKVNLLPSVALLQKNLEVILIQGWRSNFAEPTCKELNLEINNDFRTHVIGFFNFYGYKFNYENDIVCPLLGYELPKSMFDIQNLSQLPPEYAPYKKYMKDLDLKTADKIDDMFANRKPIVVQDPFDLIHNVGKGMVFNKLNKFVAFSRRSFEMLQTNE